MAFDRGRGKTYSLYRQYGGKALKRTALVIVAILGLAALAAIICMMSLVPLGDSLKLDMEKVWELAKGVGMTVGIGGLMILVLALGFTYNKPDVPPPD